MLPAPSFHHLHLNSIDPEAAIGFYTRQFPATTAQTTWGGEPALAATNDVLILFTKVGKPPVASPDATAFWHFGWHVTDSRATLEKFKRAPEVQLLPLYTSDDGGSVQISSDTWPGAAGVLGRTKSQIAEARTSGVKPAGVGGFAYMAGPDNALVEYAGNHPAERFNHVHMWQDDPFCAQLWYQKHLNAPAAEGRTSATPVTEANCKVPRGADRTWPCLEREGMYRTPRAAVTFGDVMLGWYPRQSDRPLASPRGHLIDHIGLGVADLDAWMAKLRSEDIAVEGPYPLGATRAFMIEGPSRERLELVEVR